MKLIGLIAQKDFRERLRDGRLYWAGSLILILLLTALAVGFQHQQHARAEQSVAQQNDYQDWLQQDARHPHDAAHQGMHVFKPEGALSLLDPGINPYIGSTIWLQAHMQSEVKFRPAQDASGLQRFGDLSTAWILQVLAPLLIIVLGFNAFSGEREQGILRQLMSIGIPAQKLLWGKALALAMSLAVLFIPVAMISFIAVMLSSQWQIDALLRYLLILIGYGIYFAIYILITLGVSAAVRSSRSAIIVLLGLWIASSVIAPRVMSEVSRKVYPSLTRLEFNKALSDDITATSDRVWMENFGTTVRWSSEVPLNKWGIALKLDDESKYIVFDRHFGALWDTWENQQRVQELSGWFMPLLAIRSFSAALAGTDFAHHRDFTVAAENQRRIIQDIVSDDLVKNADTLDNQHFSYQASTDLWQKVPPFNYEPPKTVWALKKSSLSIFMLGLSFLLSLVFALHKVKKQKAL